MQKRKNNAYRKSQKDFQEKGQLIARKYKTNMQVSSYTLNSVSLPDLL